MRYLLDTNIIIPHLTGDRKTTTLVRALARDGVAVSTVTLMEVWEGVFRAADPLVEAAYYQEFFDSITVLPFSETIAKRCAEIRHVLRQQGIRSRERALDLQIAATAIAHSLELVTRNVSDYDDVPGLTFSQG